MDTLKETMKMLSKEDQIELLKQDIQSWNRLRRETPDYSPDLSEADLNWANLRGANLNGADLNGADLSRADLSRANLFNAKGLPDVPIVENLFTKTLALINGGSVRLEMLSWHCETTHCIAGFAISLADLQDSPLEKKLGSSALGALIIIASCEYLEGKVPNFNASNEEGMRFIKECAGKEKP